MSQSNIADTPTEVIAQSPWSTVDRGLYIDLKCFLSSIRSMRNVLSSRIAMRSKNNVVIDQTFRLPQVASGAPFSTKTYLAESDSAALVISSNRPVHVVLTRANGTLDMGLNTLVVLTAGFTSVQITNDPNLGDAEVNLIVV